MALTSKNVPNATRYISRGSNSSRETMHVCDGCFREINRKQSVTCLRSKEEYPEDSDRSCEGCIRKAL